MAFTSMAHFGVLPYSEMLHFYLGGDVHVDFFQGIYMWSLFCSLALCLFVIGVYGFQLELPSLLYTVTPCTEAILGCCFFHHSCMRSFSDHG